MATLEPRKKELLALGRVIRERREQIKVNHRPMSQELLAERAGLHRNYAGALERGERNLSVSALFYVADALGVRASELLALAESEKRGRRRA